MVLFDLLMSVWQAIVMGHLRHAFLHMSYTAHVLTAPFSPAPVSPFCFHDMSSGMATLVKGGAINCPSLDKRSCNWGTDSWGGVVPWGQPYISFEEAGLGLASPGTGLSRLAFLFSSVQSQGLTHW